MFKRINKETAQNLLQEANSILVDIRDNESYNEGHLPNALQLTQENISSFIEQTPKESNVLVMCYHGNSSQSVAQYLASQGFSNVYSVDGGYEGWIND